MQRVWKSITLLPYSTLLQKKGGVNSFSPIAGNGEMRASFSSFLSSVSMFGVFGREKCVTDILDVSPPPSPPSPSSLLVLPSLLPPQFFGGRVCVSILSIWKGKKRQRQRRGGVFLLKWNLAWDTDTPPTYVTRIGSPLPNRTKKLLWGSCFKVEIIFSFLCNFIT